ncbi:hypothetical protein POJ06DRAFT_214578 [Lipomyces tetrasporus]|uniref:Bromodomain associated domain-containing protein n=1 Tax=Lipomyces tetrasporus TaxID=54092 RepID=A0AAD7QMM7_9ASCO|nr:uncharacterized protein POJ06DRAFT_214578 [Lipomyces tetrasporus]KAJ8097993.1 hypothetical protein POJ06DRAFT_214578 [Lipomyces tetrasporus]
MPAPALHDQMSSELFYSFLRITTAQILRASGIDRCPPSVLDTMTDLAMRYMTLLSIRAAKYAALCGRKEPDVGDIRMAMEATGGLRPMRILDEFPDEDKDDLAEDEGLQRFIEWCYNATKEFNTVAGGEELVDGLMKRQSKVSQEDRFRGTILDPSNATSENPEAGARIEGGPGPKIWSADADKNGVISQPSNVPYTKSKAQDV